MFTWTTQFAVDRVPCLPNIWQPCVIVSRFGSGQVGEGMFCGSKYVQNKDNKEITITQTEFAVKNHESSHVSCEKRKCERILLTKVRSTRFVV